MNRLQIAGYHAGPGGRHGQLQPLTPGQGQADEDGKQDVQLQLILILANQARSHETSLYV